MSVLFERDGDVRSRMAGGARPGARMTGGTMAKTVLIVEDNELNMKLFHDLLEAHGYNILQTRDGMEALKIARDKRPDLILMDIQLPEVSGLEVTKWIKEDDRLKAVRRKFARAAARPISPNPFRCRTFLRPSRNS
jgi:PleD family two-component response regulator